MKQSRFSRETKRNTKYNISGNPAETGNHIDTVIFQLRLADPVKSRNSI